MHTVKTSLGTSYVEDTLSAKALQELLTFSLLGDASAACHKSSLTI